MGTKGRPWPQLPGAMNIIKITIFSDYSISRSVCWGLERETEVFDAKETNSYSHNS